MQPPFRGGGAGGADGDGGVDGGGATGGGVGGVDGDGGGATGHVIQVIGKVHEPSSTTAAAS